MRILVVDDELDTAQTVALLLKDAGHRVTYAVTARAALAICATEKPDVVVLDLALPDMDGIALAKRLKTMHAPEPRVIAVTGCMPEAEPLALAAGCECFLLKPIDASVLHSVISAKGAGT